MQDKELITKFQRRAARVRTIAKGIFGQREREVILKFVNDCEKLVAKKPS